VDKEQRRLAFTSIVFPGKSSETNASLLAESIRAFAGSLSQAPIWILTPEYGKQLSTTIKEKLLALNVILTPFEIDYEILRFPFTGEVIATALAESMACGQTDFLVWLSANTVVLQEPKDFLLQDDKNLGFRPVHHTLVGSRYDEPLDSFWRLIYRYCNVPEDRIFPMMTHVDETRIRPYFNAGLLVTAQKSIYSRLGATLFSRFTGSPLFRKSINKTSVTRFSFTKQCCQELFYRLWRLMKSKNCLQNTTILYICMHKTLQTIVHPAWKN